MQKLTPIVMMQHDYEGGQHATNREKARQRNMEERAVAAAIAKQRAFDESRGRRPRYCTALPTGMNTSRQAWDSKAASPIEENLECFSGTSLVQ